MTPRPLLSPILVAVLALACAKTPAADTTAAAHGTPVAAATAGASAGAPKADEPPRERAATVADAAAFVEATEKELLRRWVERDRLAWLRSTYIQHDAEVLLSAAEAELMRLVAEKASEARRFDGLALDAATRRKLKLLRLAQPLPAPADAAQREELAALSTELEGMYGKGRFCPRPPDRPAAGPADAPGVDKAPRDEADDGCLDLGQLSQKMATSHNPDELLVMWRGWRQVSVPMRPKYQRFVELANKGAREQGFADLGAMWRSQYDMEPEAFEREVDRLWAQVKPLYEQLHCHVRHKLAERYGPKVVPVEAPIPAHVGGNMWAQDWIYLADILLPDPKLPPLDLTSVLKARKTTPKEMVRHGERFFTSLGLAPLPETFWERSLFAKPRDREVVCHASAWDVDWRDDLRIKMCVEINGEDFATVHHELGHNYYQRACSGQPPLFNEGANAGFHEALGDTISLSITPEYLAKIGLLDKAPEPGLNPLMERALERLAFLPFGLVVDKWRWGVFSGAIAPQRYNAAWWELRLKYQGVRPPEPRDERSFDPGAKYHVASNTSYMRYFIAHILQFQFHRALCRVAGHTGPLHTCSIYGNKAAGARLEAMMRMGASRPWPDALEALTGQREMDAGAIVDYFAPLMAWLQAENKGRTCGW